MSDEAKVEDRSYVDASAFKLGRAWGEMLAGLRATGVPRQDALEIVKLYAYGMAIKATEETDE